jgi:hypothetical protein
MPPFLSITLSSTFNRTPNTEYRIPFTVYRLLSPPLPSHSFTVIASG